MNYGNTLMARGDFKGALDYFHRAQALTPQYSFLLINLAIAESATEQTKLAEQHFQEALKLAPASPDSYIYYGRGCSRSHASPSHGAPDHGAGVEPTGSDRSRANDSGRSRHLDSVKADAGVLPHASLERYREGRYAESSRQLAPRSPCGQLRGSLE